MKTMPIPWSKGCGIGNPLTIGSATLTWRGRQLTQYVNGGNTYAYTYNDEGIRTSKTVNGVKHTYHLSGSQIVAEEWGNNLLVYLYDAEGAPLGMQYRNTSYAANVFDTYWFEKNMQGDIIAVYNDAGALLISYLYDAWGNVITTYSNGGASTKAVYNPFKYRGYYHDSETGWYYLQSRYYNSTWGRFISADDSSVITATPMGLMDKNLFAYCDNNPIMRADDGGEIWHVLAGAVLGVVAQYAYDVASNLMSGKSLTESLVPTSSWVDYLSAAASGALAATGIGAVGSAIANAAIDGAACVANSLVAGEEVDVLELTFTVAMSAATAGKGVDGANLRGVYKRSKDVLKTAVSPRKIAQYTSKIEGVKKTVRKHIIESVGGNIISGGWDGLKSRLGFS